MYIRVLGQLHHTKSIYCLYERFKKLMKIDLNFGSYVKLLGPQQLFLLLEEVEEKFIYFIIFTFY